MSVIDRADSFQRRHRVIGFPLAVVYKFVDDQGAYLAALMTYYGFVSLFPLLLLLSTVLSIVLIGHPAVQQQLLNSAVRQIPVVGQQIGDPRKLGGGVAGLVIGLLGAVYGALGVAQAFQNAMNVAWSVPRNSRPNPFQARGRSIVLLLVIAVTVVATTSLARYGTSFSGASSVLLNVIVVLLSLAINATAFTFGFRFATTAPLSRGAVLPGAITASVLWQVLQTGGVAYVSHVVNGATATNGVFAVVLGLVAFLFATSVTIVLCAEINVVRVGQLWPRALLTPFTDNVELTAGDVNAYSRQATAQRHKGFEKVRVTFDRRDRSDSGEQS